MATRSLGFPSQMALKGLLLLSLTHTTIGFDCCGGRECNDNWDMYDSATGHCCMLPNGGKMQEETAVGSCSCPSLQSCDKGPKAQAPQPPPPPPPPPQIPAQPQPVPQPEPAPEPQRNHPSYYHGYRHHRRRSNKGDPYRTFEWVMVTCTLFLAFAIGIALYCAVRGVSSSADTVRKSFEGMPLRGEPIQTAHPMVMDNKGMPDPYYMHHGYQAQNSIDPRLLMNMLQFMSQEQQRKYESSEKMHQSESLTQPMSSS
mmetsp:Transcript_15119/g.29717  ORF Transcript_15119/g.29717 Transcript_15119/m.29717 type:complete len:257 (+) Transcript_15119:55-825(+)